VSCSFVKTALQMIFCDGKNRASARNEFYVLYIATHKFSASKTTLLLSLSDSIDLNVAEILGSE
jgi:hypothetical protein